MRVLKNKSGLNEKSFDESDYVVLSYEELLKVNGAGGSSSSSSSTSSSSTTSSNSSSGDSSSNNSVSSLGSIASTIVSSSSIIEETANNIVDREELIVNESVSSSTTTQNTSSQTTEPEDVFIENSNYGVANAKPGDKMKREDGTIVVITQGDIDWAKNKLGIDETTSSSNEEITAPTTGSVTNEGVTTENTTPSLENNVTEDATLPPTTKENDVSNNSSVVGSTTSTTEPFDKDTGTLDEGSIADTTNTTTGDTTETVTEKTSGSWGEIVNEIARNSTMQDHANDGLNKMNGKDDEGKDNQFSKVGCKMEGASKILTEIVGKDIDITKVNDNYDTNDDGLMTQTEITAAIENNLSDGQTVVSDYWEKQLTKKKLDEIANSQEGTTYVLGRAEDVCGGQHWIVLEGYSVNASGQVVFEYNGTSQNDARNNRTYILGEPTAEQKANNYYQISKIETYTII